MQEIAITCMQDRLTAIFCLQVVGYRSLFARNCKLLQSTKVGGIFVSKDLVAAVWLQDIAISCKENRSVAIFWLQGAGCRSSVAGDCNLLQ